MSALIRALSLVLLLVIGPLSTVPTATIAHRSAHPNRVSAFGGADTVGLKILGSLGGWIGALAVSNGFAYIGEGRALTIVDIRNPATPMRTGSISLPAAAIDIQVRGSRAFVQYEGPYGSTEGIQIIDVHDPAHPSVQTTVIHGSLTNLGWVRRPQIVGDLLYVAIASNIWIFDVSRPGSAAVRSLYYGPATLEKLQVIGNLAYVLIGDDQNLVQIVDVSNPAAPVLRGQYFMASYPQDLQVVGRFAYLTNQEGFQIVDMTNPASPRLRGTLPFAPGFASGVQVVGNLAYVSYYSYGASSAPSHPQIGGPTLIPSVALVDVSDPDHPFEWSDLPPNTRGVVPAGHLAYAFTDQGVQIFDVSHPATPVVHGTYPSASFGFQPDSNVIYLTTSRALSIVAVTNVDNPTLIGSYSTPLNQPGFHVMVVNHLAYYVTLYGMHIIDVTDPSNPRLLGSYSSDVSTGEVWVAGNIAYLATESGLALIDVRDPTNPTRLGLYRSNAPVADVQVAGNLAYIALSDLSGGSMGLEIVDVAVPTNPTLRGRYTTLGSGEEVEVIGTTAYIFGLTPYPASSYFQIIDVSDPTQPALRGTYTTNEYIQRLQVVGAHAYLAMRTPPWGTQIELRIMDVSNPAEISTLGSYHTDVFASPAIAVADDRVYLSLEDLLVLDVHDPTNPTLRGTSHAALPGNSIALDGHLIYIADNTLGLTIVTALDPVAFLPQIAW